MKNSFQRIRAIFALVAGFFFAFLLASCADFSGSATGSVSFSLSPELVKAVSKSSRAAVSGEDDVVSEGSDESSTDTDNQNEESSSEKIVLDISLKGDYSDSKHESFSIEDWYNKYDDVDKTESGSGNSSGIETITFDNIPVGSKVYATVDVYSEYTYNGRTDTTHMLTGTSPSVTIAAGQNAVALNVHSLKYFAIYMNTDTGETITDIDKIDLYLIPSSDELAEELLAYAKKDDNDSLVDALKQTTPYKTYTNMEDPYFHDSFDLKTGDSYYVLALLYKDDKTYFAHPDEQASGAITVSEYSHVALYLTLISGTEADEDEYFDMNFSGAANDPASLGGTFTLAITSKGTYTITYYSQDSQTAEPIEQVVSEGTYRVNGDDFYYTENSYSAFNSTSMTFASSLTTISNPTESEPVTVKDGGSGEVDSFEITGANGVTILFQMPTEVNLEIYFMIYDDNNGTYNEHNHSNFTVSMIGDDVELDEEIQKTIEETLSEIYAEGYVLEADSDLEPVYNSETNTWVIEYKFKKSTEAGIGYVIEVSAPQYTDGNLELSYKGDSDAYTFTATEGFESYTWFIDDVLVSAATESTYWIEAADVSTGNHSIMVVVTDSEGSRYSASVAFKVSAQ